MTATQPSRDDISKRALEIWEEEGRPEGRALEHWTRAEKELSSRQNGQTETTGAPNSSNPMAKKQSAPKQTAQPNPADNRQKRPGNR
jgi:hypothetical protein